MSLIDMTQLDRLRHDTATDCPAPGRDAACVGVERELRSRGRHPDQPAVALRSYGDGCLVVGIAGPVDRPMARRFGTLLRGLRPFSTRELLLTFVLLGPWDPQLARVVGQARVHHLIDGGHLELRGAPPAIFAAIGAPPPDSAIRPSASAEEREPCLEEWGLRL